MIKVVFLVVGSVLAAAVAAVVLVVGTLALRPYLARRSAEKSDLAGAPERVALNPIRANETTQQMPTVDERMHQPRRQVKIYGDLGKEGAVDPYGQRTG